MCRAYSSIMWTSTQRSESGPRSGSSHADRQQVGRRGDEPVGVLDLVPPGGPGLRDDRRIGHRAVEVAVRVLLARSSGGTSSPARPRRNQLRSTSARCRTRPSRDRVDGGTARRGELLRIQAGALELQRLALPAQEALQSHGLVGATGGVHPPVLVEVDEHVREPRRHAANHRPLPGPSATELSPLASFHEVVDDAAQVLLVVASGTRRSTTRWRRATSGWSGGKIGWKIVAACVRRADGHCGPQGDARPAGARRGTTTRRRTRRRPARSGRRR